MPQQVRQTYAKTYKIMNSNEKYVSVYMSKIKSGRIINSYHIQVLNNTVAETNFAILVFQNHLQQKL